MKRPLRRAEGSLDHERWSFDDPTPVVPHFDKLRSGMPQESLLAARGTAQQDASAKPREDAPPVAPAQPRPKTPPMTPSATDMRATTPATPPREFPKAAAPSGRPGVSPWRKITIPDEERRRAAAAGIFRYVGKPGADAERRRQAAAPPVDDIDDYINDYLDDDVNDNPASFARRPPDPEEDLARAQAAANRARHEERMRHERQPREPPPYAQPRYKQPGAATAHANPHLGVTVAVILAVSIAAAVGLSWVAAPGIDAASSLRADLLDRLSPQRQTAEQPAAERPSFERPATNAPTAIEVAPDKPRPPVTANRLQPIEVAP